MLRHTALVAAASLLSLSATSAYAQSGGIGKSIAREVDRMVAVERSQSTRAGRASQQDTPPAKSQWSVVRDLNPGYDELIVTRFGGEPGRRIFVRADDAELEVVNLTNLKNLGGSGGTISAHQIAHDELRAVADDHPPYFARARRGETFQLKHNVRLGPDGVFVRDWKVADLDQVFETIPRRDIDQISLFSKHVAPHLIRGVVIGAVVGGLIVFLGEIHDEKDMYIGVGAMVGAAIGSAIGATAGGIAPRRPDVIYRAPHPPAD